MGARFFVFSFFVLMGVAMADTPATDGYFSYYVNNYPKGTATCDAHAKDIAARVEQTTHVAIWRAEVLSENHGSCWLRITYRAAQELPLVTTMRAEISEYPGTYETLEACVKDLGRQIDYFERATGLPWVVAFCDPEPYFGWDYPVAVHIDALGAPALAPFRFYDFISRLDATDLQKTLQELVQNATTQGLYISQIVVGEDEAMLPRIVVDYYAANQLPFRLWQRLEYDSLAACKAALPQLRQGLTEAGAKPLTVFCSGSDDGANAAVLVVDDNSVDYFQAPQPYTSRADCESDRARVLQEYQQQFHWDVKSAFCGGIERFNNVRMFLLHRRDAKDVDVNPGPVSPFPPPPHALRKL